MTQRTAIYWCLFLLLFLTVSLIVQVTEAAHSRRRPVARRESTPKYDRAITTFSNDGRLLQVEYGMKAADRGDTVAAMAVSLTDNGNTDGSRDEYGFVCIAVAGSSERKVQRIDEHVLLMSSGLSGDMGLVAKILRRYCQQHRMAFGEAPTVQEVSKYLAEIQHGLTKVSGTRPLGCSCIVAGLDVSPEDDGLPGIVRLFGVEAGGILEEYTFCAVGKGRAKATKVLEELERKVMDSNNDIEQPDKGQKDRPIPILQSVSQGVTDAVFLSADDGGSKSSTDQKLDLWIIRCDPHRRQGRGKIHIACAKDLNRNKATLMSSLIGNAWSSDTLE